jgi:hypothetical protein
MYPRLKEYLTNTSDNWGALNPILEAGVIGVENDTGLLKVGNGSDNWNDISYSSELFVAAPEAADDPGIAGQIAWDEDYFYVCVDDDVWKRVELTTWSED